MADRTAEDVERFLKQVRELGDEVGGPWSPTAEIELILMDCMVSDAEARLLAYLTFIGIGEVSARDLAVNLGWSKTKTYYVIGKLERAGRLRRTERGVCAK